MYSIERKSEILKILEQSGKVDVNDLSRQFNASKETIRRDLRDMEVDGVLKRTHGGAVFISTATQGPQEFPLHIREIQHFAEKDAICKLAASFIEPGDSIFIDNSSTCINLVKYIPAEYQVTVITNSIKVLMESSRNKNPDHLIICLGGFFNESNLSLYGNIAQKNAGDYYPNKAFMSCAGIYPPDQLVDSSFLEVDTKRLMIERSREVFMLVDNSKFKRNGQVFLADISTIHTVITDNQIQPDQLVFLENAGIRTLIA
jgi:DeoR family transcriptional regulator, fructose operon transcriptional repressor